MASDALRSILAQAQDANGQPFVRGPLPLTSPGAAPLMIPDGPDPAMQTSEERRKQEQSIRIYKEIDAMRKAGKMKGFLDQDTYDHLPAGMQAAASDMPIGRAEINPEHREQDDIMQRFMLKRLDHAILMGNSPQEQWNQTHIRPGSDPTHLVGRFAGIPLPPAPPQEMPGVVHARDTIAKSNLASQQDIARAKYESLGPGDQAEADARRRRPADAARIAGEVYNANGLITPRDRTNDSETALQAEIYNNRRRMQEQKAEAARAAVSGAAANRRNRNQALDKGVDPELDISQWPHGAWQPPPQLQPVQRPAGDPNGVTQPNQPLGGNAPVPQQPAPQAGQQASMRPPGMFGQPGGTAGVLGLSPIDMNRLADIPGAMEAFTKNKDREFEERKLNQLAGYEDKKLAQTGNLENKKLDLTASEGSANRQNNLDHAKIQAGAHEKEHPWDVLSEAYGVNPDSLAVESRIPEALRRKAYDDGKVSEAVLAAEMYGHKNGIPAMDALTSGKVTVLDKDGTAKPVVMDPQSARAAVEFHRKKWQDPTPADMVYPTKSAWEAKKRQARMREYFRMNNIGPPISREESIRGLEDQETSRANMSDSGAGVGSM
jgi:hypothetical protein